VAAIRGFLEDWLGAYEEYEIEAEEILDLGNGVVLFVIRSPLVRLAARVAE